MPAARPATETVACIDAYTAPDRDLFTDVRSFDHFTRRQLGLLRYAVTIVLAAMGGQDRAHDQPYLPLALMANVLVDAGQDAKLTVDQWTKHRAVCSWCLLAAPARPARCGRRR